MPLPVQLSGVPELPEVQYAAPVVSTKNSFLHFEDAQPVEKCRRPRSLSDATVLATCKRVEHSRGEHALSPSKDVDYASDSTAATAGEVTPDRATSPDRANGNDSPADVDLAEVRDTRYLLDLGKAPLDGDAPKKKRRDVPPPLTNEITLMVRNIPNKYTPEGLLQTFAEYRQSITFYYLPTDFKNKCNLGYAFVNFCDKEVAQRFAVQLQNAKLPHFEKSEKVLLVQPARVQGFAANVKRFRNSSVMGVLPEDCKPMIFDNGAQQPFPTPAKKIPPIGPRFRANQ